MNVLMEITRRILMTQNEIFANEKIDETEGVAPKKQHST